jgi:hypothetical protein
VADVRLETTRRLEVPQADGAVVRSGEDIFRIWGELHVLARVKA